LALRSLDWREVRLEDVGEFVAWLRLPPAGRAGKALVLPSVDAQVGAATVNRKLSAVSSFYQHQTRHGVDVGELLVVWKPGGRGGWNPFLHHISKGLPQPHRAISLRAPRKLPRVLTATETRSNIKYMRQMAAAWSEEAIGQQPVGRLPWGFEAAYGQASEIAGDKGVDIAGGASTARQALIAGVIDELTLDIAPTLLGAGERMFDSVASFGFEPVEVLHSPLTTHIRYRRVNVG